MNYLSYDNMLSLLPMLAAKISGGARFEDWQANTSYAVDDIIVYEGQFYKVNTAFTSGSTFSDTNLDQYVPQELTAAQIQAIVNAI